MLLRPGILTSQPAGGSHRWDDGGRTLEHLCVPRDERGPKHFGDSDIDTVRASQTAGDGDLRCPFRERQRESDKAHAVKPFEKLHELLRVTRFASWPGNGGCALREDESWAEDRQALTADPPQEAHADGGEPGGTGFQPVV